MAFTLARWGVVLTRPHSVGELDRSVKTQGQTMYGHVGIQMWCIQKLRSAMLYSRRFCQSRTGAGFNLSKNMLCRKVNKTLPLASEFRLRFNTCRQSSVPVIIGVLQILEFLRNYRIFVWINYLINLVCHIKI